VSYFVCIGEIQVVEAEYATAFGCERIKFAICYLGIAIHYERYLILEWRKVDERIQISLRSSK
jgi:hypothetical protein